MATAPPMTVQKNNPVLELFASVQLALFLLFLLASTSIIGTVIPQNNVPQFYVDEYGPKTARLLQILDIPDMYNSWWFLLLLALFALNLIVCSLERIPQVIRTVRRDGLGVSKAQMEKQPLHATLVMALPPLDAQQQIKSLLTAKGWKIKTAARETGIQFFTEKGAWSRFGVYVVHASILIILAGALLGSSAVATKLLHNPQFAFKGSIMMPETEASDHILAFKTGRRIDLGFALRCDAFAIEFYGNGMPKTYRTQATIIDGGKEVLRSAIEVNTPLTYKGITFYQSSYQPSQDYAITLKKKDGQAVHTAVIPPASERQWPENKISYGIINRERQGEVTRRVKIWFSDNQGEPSVFWLDVNQEAAIERPSGTYLLTVRQRYATGLQVTKDPGVWLVYSGCFLMLAGLYCAFFQSHRRLYGLIEPNGTGSRILLAGNANKNKLGFERYFSDFIKTLEQ